MPDSSAGNSSIGGRSDGKRTKKRGGKNNKGNKNSQENNNAKSDETNSTTSSSQASSIPKSSPELPPKQLPQKVKMLKRDAAAPPVPLIPSYTSMPPSFPTVPQPLMAVNTLNTAVGQKSVPFGSYHGSTVEKAPPKQPSSLNGGRGADVNNQQRTAYYFTNPGQAVAQTVIKAPQCTRENFPIVKNENILIDNKYSLLISPTTSRCGGLYIRVKAQKGDDFSTGALILLDSGEKTIKKACKEAMNNFDKVSARFSSERHPFSDCSESYLKVRCIKRLENRLEAFPDAIYYCEMCDYHISTINHAKAHLESSSHYDDLNRKEQRKKLLKGIPPPIGNHLSSINKVLNEVLEEYKEVQQRGGEISNSVLYYLKTSVFPALGCPDVILRPFGSSTYDVVLPDSDYNVAYTMDLPDNTPIFSFLEKVRKRIADDGHPADHSMEMGTPSTIIFSFEGVRVRLCWMSCFNNRSQLHLSSLMKTYVDLRKEVVQFLQLIRLWAAKAGVDSKNKPRIGLPRYGFDLMAIHFLQKQGYLPILHEMYEKEEKAVDSEAQAEGNQDNESAEKLKEAGRKRILEMSRYEKDIEKIKSKFDLKKSWNMAELFVKFFRYYVDQHRDIVIQITQSKPMTRDEKRWNKKVLHVVDPFRGDNVLSIPKVSTWQPFYFNCLLTTFLSFAIPRNVDGPVVEVTLIHNKTIGTKKKTKEPQTPKPPGTPKLPKPSTEITDEQYVAAADRIAEEEEHEQHMKQLLSRTAIDGIKYCNRKPENYDIDDHWNSVYGRQALKRFKRVLPCNINESMALAIEDANFDLLTKRGKGWLKRWRKNQEAEAVEQTSESPESDAAVVEITEKLEETLKIPDASSEVLEETATVIEEETQKESEQTTPAKIEVSSEVSVKIEAPEVSEEVPVKVLEESEVVEVPEAPNAPEETPEVQKIPEEEAPPCLGAELVAESGSIRSESIADSTLEDVLVTKEPKEPVVLQKQTATFVKPKVAPLVEKQICCEEFFIKDGTEYKGIATAKTWKPDDYHYEFTTEFFTGGFEMEMKCTHCDGSHCVENCPMMEIPPIVKFEARTPEELKDIDDVIDWYYKKNILDETRMQQMEAKKHELEKYLQKNLHKDVTLTIFGSVMTGLSVNCSDIDICLRFGANDTPPANKSAKDVIQEAGYVLRRCPLVRTVQTIVTAKVPIVKFQLRMNSGEMIDADISYYNVLAIHNTRLLKEYTFWTPDNRFAKLALFVKRWAKSCDIGDASRGSLSSYAHIILLISYLQNCDPPVLPRLQEDFRSDNREKRMIENWDTSFAEVEETLQKTWPKNKESCAQLLIGYFDYYSRFDFRNFVVQCRREMTLSKMEKDWPRPICVEDPFDLNHNLSSGVNKKMFVFIMKVFINSRAVFMSETPQKRDINFALTYEKQLLDKCNQGSAPTDRQCHNCHRIGHFYESCPQRPQGKDARRRFGSNSTSTSYRSNDGFNYRGSDDSGGAKGDSIQFFKRAYYQHKPNTNFK